MQKFKKTNASFKSFATVLSLIAICLIFGLINPVFLTGTSLHSVLVNAVPVGLVAVGAGICLMGGYFDMGVGMVAGLAGVLVTYLMDAELPIVLVILIPMLMGAFCGLLAGSAVSFLNMNAWISTFALQQIYRTLLYVITNGVPISLGSTKYAAFTQFGRMKVFGVIQFPIVVLVVVYGLCYLFLRYRELGRSVYVVGSNPLAARICGVNLHKTRLFMFILTNTLASVAGMLLAARMATAAPFAGESFAFEAIAAGMVSGMGGGKGNLLMVFVGVLILFVIKSGLVMIGLPDFYQYMATGLVMLIACVLQTEKKKR